MALQTAEPDIAVLGGKGANLAGLTRAGFDVPRGFCVTTTGYRRMLESGPGAHIADLIESIDFSDSASVESSCSAIRSAIESAELSQDLADDIVRAYAGLGADARVAVRSSGTAEDLADTSFAGLHDTYLDIVGADSVLEATKRCWASMWSARAAAYRQAHGFDHMSVALAVVVQRWWPPTSQASLSASTPAPPPPTRSSSTPAGGSASPSCPVTSRPTSSP